MKRRTFLKTTLASASALALGPVACDDGGGDGDGLQDGAEFFPQSLASGDPRPDGVILWTRVAAPDRADEDVVLTLQVARDDAFSDPVALNGGAELQVTAEAASDHCVKVRLTSLEAGTTYWYRFVYARDGGRFASRTGRTRTAPAADADVPVRFAVMSCQDYNGRYYNPLRALAELDVDFFVHLGDYVYETTGDPAFQDVTDERSVVFEDQDGALSLGEGEGAFQAAASLSNYRDLYRTYRSDPDLQRVHELFPMIAIWDDHEFSDDCYGQTATYFDGAVDETSPDRRAAADQAWSEFMPVDFDAPTPLPWDPSEPFPDDLRIYRDFTFGQHVHLVMTDLRRYRSDHVVPEDAFPGAVAATEAQLQAALGEVPAGAAPYVDVDTFDGGAYAAALQGDAELLGWPEDLLSGLLSVGFVNQQVATINAEAAQEVIAPISEADQAGLERGFAWHHLLKSSLHTAVGARYLVKQEAFDAISAVLWEESGGASEVAMGEDQRQWFLDTVTGSDRTWKVWGNEFTLMSRRIDLAPFQTLPDSFRGTFYLSAEDWDGLPHRRAQLVDALTQVDNVVAVTGDIHAFFAGTPTAEGDPDRRMVELVAGAVSSGTYQQLLVRQASSDPTLAAMGASALALLVEDLLQDPESRPNPHLAFADTDRHGLMVVDADGARLEATMYAIERQAASARIEETGEALLARFDQTRFKVEAGSPDLFRDEAGAWLRWDPETQAWV